MRRDPGPDFRWGLILRRSQYNQDGTEGSTRRQELAVSSHIKANNMGIVAAVYKDIAAAYQEGAQRPEFENALIDLQAGRIDGIAVWKIDRLVRRAKQYRRVLGVLEESGGRLFSQMEGIDTAAEGTAKIITNTVLGILVALAEMESDNTSARLILMAEERARMGKVHRGSKRPWGHSEDWMSLVADEVRLANEAAQRIVKGETPTAITNDWRERGIKSVMGKDWLPGTLKSILMSPRMVAKREYGGSVFDLEDVPPILPTELWEQVCARLDNEYIPRQSTKRLLSGILTCPTCGHHLSGNLSTKGAARYACRKRPGRPDACGGNGGLCDAVDAVVGAKMVEFLADRERVSTLLRQHAPGPEMDELHARQSELNDSLLALDKALNPPPGIRRMPIERYWRQVEEIEAERAELNRRLAISREAALIAETLNGEWTPETWAAKPLDWKRLIIRLATVQVTLESRGRIASRDERGRNVFDPSRVIVKFAA
jgi:site-specific DNA recombinase